jgi:enterochelin esterase family protein
MPLDIETHLALGLDQPVPQGANGKTNMTIMEAIGHPSDNVYHPCPEAYPAPDIPEGSLHRWEDWQDSAVYPGTLRNLYAYVPAGVDADQELNLMVFNDGIGYVSRKGDIRVPRVLDTLHARGEIEPTLAVFVNPGRPVDQPDDEEAGRVSRRLEYDAMTPKYGEFIIGEILPFMARELGVRITEDPDCRTTCGISSGGICAFTLAWQYPDSFRRVLSHCGSFTDILGGHNYPYLIRATPRKPLRIYLQSGEHDAQTLSGDWPLANKQIASSLTYAGYDHHFEFGMGGHTLRHGGAVFADSVRWLWR